MKLSFGDGFKFGCGVYLAFAVAYIVSLIVMAIMAFAGSDAIRSLLQRYYR